MVVEPVLEPFFFWFRDGATAMANTRAMYMAVAMAWVMGRDVIMAKAMAS